MNELVVIVEGETELAFVRDQLAAHLALHGTAVWPVLPGRHRPNGGVKKWETARDVLRERCEHFASWLVRLENLGTETN